jgi:hypothetical protein
LGIIPVSQLAKASVGIRCNLTRRRQSSQPALRVASLMPMLIQSEAASIPPSLRSSPRPQLRRQPSPPLPPPLPPLLPHIYRPSTTGSEQKRTASRRRQQQQLPQSIMSTVPPTAAVLLPRHLHRRLPLQHSLHPHPRQNPSCTPPQGWLRARSCRPRHHHCHPIKE